MRKKAFDSILDATLAHLPQPLPSSSMAHRGGKCWGTRRNASLVRRTPWPQGKWNDNYKMYQHYRFCLVPDKLFRSGYVTEKIVLAFWGGCIPLYYGTDQVFDIFNRHAFIYFNFSDPQPALDQIVHLESNRTAYYNMLDQPILANGTETMKRYFVLQGNGLDTHGSLKHKIRETACALSGDSNNNNN